MQNQLLPDTATISSEGILHIAYHSIPDLAQDYGTPIYIFDRATIISACTRYKQAFQKFYTASPVQILYASKAYLSLLIAQLIVQQGMGLDVVSGGELIVAQTACFPMERISFHGNNKSEEELRLAIKLGAGRIVLDNWSELERLTRMAREMQQKPRVLVRVAPGVQTDTHRYLQTGHAASKFGFPLGNGEAEAALLKIVQEGQLHLSGLHAHTGTMLRETRPYQESLERMLVLATKIYRKIGWWPEEISPGGGWAVETLGNETIPGVESLAQALQATMTRGLRNIDETLPAPTLIIEPGRSIIARAGVAIYTFSVSRNIQREAHTMTGKHQDKRPSDIDEHDQPTEPMSQVILSPFSPTAPRLYSTPPYRNQNRPGPQANEGSLPQQTRDNFFRQGVFFPSPHTSTYPRVSPVTGTNRNGQPLQPAHLQSRPSPLPISVAIIFVAVQLLLLVRFVLQLFISPGNALWVSLIYALSSIFILPFRLLLQSIAFPIPFGTELLNPLAILLAILIYGLLSRLLVRFLKALLNSG